LASLPLAAAAAFGSGFLPGTAAWFCEDAAFSAAIRLSSSSSTYFKASFIMIKSVSFS